MVFIFYICFYWSLLTFLLQQGLLSKHASSLGVISLFSRRTMTSSTVSLSHLRVLSHQWRLHPLLLLPHMLHKARRKGRMPWSDRGQRPRSKWVWWSSLLFFLVHSAFILSILFLTIFMLIFRLNHGAHVFGIPTMGFTLPIYAHDMAMVLAVQPSPTKASIPSLHYDPRTILIQVFCRGG